MLLRAVNDTHWYPVEVTGRFSMESECAASPAHRTKAIESALLAFIENQKRSHDSHFLAKWPVRVSEPMPHIAFSEDANSDLGPAGAPDPRDRERYEAWGKAEKARAARKAGLNVGMVDFTITARFSRKMRQLPLVIAPGATTASGLVLAK
jgi:hypothetical protein